MKQPVPSHWIWIFSLTAALLYIIPVFDFIVKSDYTKSWLLYVGNFIFMIVIAAFLFFVSSRKDNDFNIAGLIVAGEKTVALGMLLACALCVLILMVYVPDFFHGGNSPLQLANKPANTISGKTNGMIFMVFANAVLGNIFAGSFVSILFPFSMKRYQKPEKDRSKAVIE